MAVRNEDGRGRDTNADPITGATGSHPVGVGVGAAGAGAAGAAIGAIGGPVGAIAGAAIGAVAGGLAGKAAAEAIDPTEEDRYWRENYRSQPYVSGDEDYDSYQPAYQYGWESRAAYPDREFDEVEPDLETRWAEMEPVTNMTWQKARQPARDAWDRVAGFRPARPR